MNNGKKNVFTTNKTELIAFLIYATGKDPYLQVKNKTCLASFNTDEIGKFLKLWNEQPVDVEIHGYMETYKELVNKMKEMIKNGKTGINK